MLPKDQPQHLQQHEVLRERRVLAEPDLLFESVALHFSKKSFDDLRKQKIETSEDKCNYKTHNDFFLVGKE